MKSDPIESSAVLALQRATHSVLHLLATELADLDLTASEVNVLANLADGHGRTVTQLATATGRRPTTLTSVLDRLERRGHITRGSRAGDRRSVLIELTEIGRVTAEAIREALAEFEAHALDDLSRSQIAGFHAVLDAMTRPR